MALTLTVVRQLEGTPGLVGYALDAELLRKTFWTLSAWDSATSLGAFARSLPHTRVIRELRGRMSPTTFVTWELAGTDLPVSWEDARTRIHVAADGTPGSPQGRA